MPDSLDELRDALRTAPVHPLPAAEVRRRGDRRRRRTFSVVAVGAALVVAAVAVPLSLRDDGDGVSAGQAPSAGPSSMPDDFPLTAGMGPGAHILHASSDPDLEGYPVHGQACEGVAAWDLVGATTVALASDDAGATRWFALYPDATAAAATLDQALRAVVTCDARKVPAGTLLPQPLETNAGEDSYAFVDPQDPDWVVTSLTRVGNTLLVDQRIAPKLPVPSGADPLKVSGQAEADQMARDAARTVPAMCVWGTDRCPSAREDAGRNVR